MKIKLVITALILSVLFGCSDAQRAGYNAWGQKHRIILYSGGKTVGEWESTGKIENEEHGDGRYFKDDKTGQLVSISGTYSIEVIK